MQLQNVYASIATAASHTSQCISHAATVAGNHASQAASTACRVTALALCQLSRWAGATSAFLKHAVLTGWNFAKVQTMVGLQFAQTQAVHALEFTKLHAANAWSFTQAHPVGVGLGVSALILAGTLAVAYDRSLRAENA